MNLFCSLGAGGLLGVTPPALRRLAVEQADCTNCTSRLLTGCYLDLDLWVSSTGFLSGCQAVLRISALQAVMSIPANSCLEEWLVHHCVGCVASVRAVRLLYLLTAFGIPTWGLLLPSQGCTTGCFRAYCCTGRGSMADAWSIFLGHHCCCMRLLIPFFSCVVLSHCGHDAGLLST